MAYADEFRAAMNAAPQYQEKKGIPKWIIFVGIAFVLILVGVVVLTIVFSNTGRSAEELEEEEKQAFLEENDTNDNYAMEAALAEEDVLNPIYAAEVKKNSHANYQTKQVGEVTQYFELSPAAICVKLGVKCSDFAQPENISRLSKVTAVNTNAISYYLDNGYVVVMKAFGEYPYSLDKGGVVVIYAANYGMGYVFNGFIPNTDGKPSPVLEFKRSDLVSGIVGVPTCYVVKL